MTEDLPDGAPVMLRMSVERENGYLSWLGVQMDDIEFGSARLSLPFDEKFTDREADPPSVHHGVVATLFEQTGELAIRTTMPDPVNDSVEALSLDLNVLGEAVHDLTATAEVLETGQTSAVAAVTVESRKPNGNRGTIVTGQGVYRIQR